jgi:fucose permease
VKLDETTRIFTTHTDENRLYWMTYLNVLLNRIAKACLAPVFSLQFLVGGLGVILAPHIQESLNITPRWIGFVVTIQVVLYAVSSGCAGYVCRTLGYRNTSSLALLGCGVEML